MRVGNAHHQNAAIAVHVFRGQTLDVRLIPRVGARRGSNVPGFVGHGQLGTIGVKARHQIDHTGVQQFGHLGILAIHAEQMVQPIQASRAGGQLGSVYVAIDPECGLVDIRACCMAGDGQQPNGPVFVASAKFSELDQVWPGGGECLKQLRQFFMFVKAIELGFGQRQEG